MEFKTFNAYDIRDALHENNRISIDKANAFMDKYVFPLFSYIRALEDEVKSLEVKCSEAESKANELENKNAPLNELINDCIEKFITERVEVEVEKIHYQYDSGSYYKATVNIKG